MTDEHRVAELGPFGSRHGPVATLARRLGCTEGQLYSIAIGLLFTWSVLANALPDVDWDRSDATGPAPFALAEVASPAQPPGLLAPPPPTEPILPPVLASRSGLIDRPVSTTPVSDPSGSAGSPGDEAPPVPDPAEPSPIRVTDGGFASAHAGTPLAAVGVPDGSVAVGRRAGQTDKISYLRLAGRGGMLDLEIDPNGANVLDPLAGLMLCVVTEAGWTVGHGDVSLADAPPFDCTNGIVGTRGDTGERWIFDVSLLDLATIPGVAIVPDDDAVAPQFQVVFRVADAT